MATIARASAALRIIGESLIPSEITNLLGASPTSAQSKGQESTDGGDTDNCIVLS